jgi:hypothetical protein
MLSRDNSYGGYVASPLISSFGTNHVLQVDVVANKRSSHRFGKNRVESGEYKRVWG